MKLNYKRVVLVGMAFFLISAFWQAYDAIVPLILTNHFGMPQTASGAVMSLDNVLAVFMLPIFGALSDKTRSRFGKRTPYIFFGTIAAVISFVCLTFIDNYQLTKVLFGNLPSGQTAETLQKLTWELTLSNIWPLVGFIATLLVVLISMATFRSPAVALMPDVTVKPLRSKANAVINLTGTAGGILVLVLGMVFSTSKNKYMSYTGYVLAVCAIMLLGFVLFLLTVKEKKWAAEMEEDTAKYGLEAPVSPAVPAEKHKLTKGELTSLLLLLASVALWFIGYNSITSKYSVYASNELGFDYNFTLIVAQAAAIVSYIPVGIISSKLGRKKTILGGILMLAAAFAGGTLVSPETPAAIMYPIFALAGIGWASINVNSFPMAVEIAKDGDVGRYTGYYYTFSMAAQVCTPILSGALVQYIGYGVVFPYCAVFTVLAACTMLMVRHGDARVEAKKGLEALDIDD